MNSVVDLPMAEEVASSIPVIAAATVVADVAIQEGKCLVSLLLACCQCVMELTAGMRDSLVVVVVVVLVLGLPLSDTDSFLSVDLK